MPAKCRNSTFFSLFVGLAIIAAIHVSLSNPDPQHTRDLQASGLVKGLGVVAAAVAAGGLPRLLKRRSKPKRKVGSTSSYSPPQLDAGTQNQLQQNVGNLVTVKFPNSKDVIISRLLKLQNQMGNLYATVSIENGKVGTELACNVVRDMAMKAQAAEALQILQKDKQKMGKEATLSLQELAYIRQLAFRASLNAVTNGTHEGVSHMVGANASVITIKADCINFPPKDELDFFNAVNKDDEATVDRLLEQGINANLKDASGRNALYYACREGRESIAKKLIAKGCEVDASALNGATPMFVAAQSGHTGIMKALVAAGADVKSPRNVTYPFIACQNGHRDALNLLLENGANPSAPSMNGFSCLYIAAQNGHNNVIDRLCQIPSIKATINEGMSARSMATPALIAAQMGHLDVLKTLHKNGADINQAMTDGTRPFKVAAAQGDPDLLEFLLDNGADVNSPNKDGNTALMAAVVKSNVRAVELLIKRGANVGAKTTQGFDAVMLARERQNREIIDILQKASKTT
mmetsp:Transcript_9147/g.13719  ORF Transcript_9147/g.13719 Transcript_9147/m.13719 type:complete len:520 (+) Transcript_9147:75-1634(+)